MRPRIKGLVVLACVSAGVALASGFSMAQNRALGNAAVQNADVLPAGETPVFVPNGTVAYAEELTDLVLARAGESVANRRADSAGAASAVVSA